MDDITSELAEHGFSIEDENGQEDVLLQGLFDMVPESQHDVLMEYYSQITDRAFCEGMTHRTQKIVDFLYNSDYELATQVENEYL